MIKDFTKACAAKMKKGVSDYGAFNPETDSRDFFDEMKGECEDIGNYSAMLWEQIDKAQKRFHKNMKKFND